MSFKNVFSNEFSKESFFIFIFLFLFLFVVLFFTYSDKEKTSVAVAVAPAIYSFSEKQLKEGEFISFRVEDAYAIIFLKMKDNNISDILITDKKFLSYQNGPVAQLSKKFLADQKSYFKNITLLNKKENTNKTSVLDSKKLPMLKVPK